MFRQNDSGERSELSPNRLRFNWVLFKKIQIMERMFYVVFIDLKKKKYRIL